MVFPMPLNPFWLIYDELHIFQKLIIYFKLLDLKAKVRSWRRISFVSIQKHVYMQFLGF